MKKLFARISKWLWAGVVAMAFLPAAVAADDWPMFRADAGRTGVVGTSGALNDASPWIFPTGGAIRSSPAIVGSTVYFGSDDGNVYAVNALSGELVWRVQTGGPVRTSPAVMDGFVFIGGVFGLFRISADVGNVEILFDEGSVDSSPAFVGDRVLFVTRSGELRAIDYRSLRDEWVYPLPNPTVSSPAVVGGTAYVFSGSQLVAIDVENGPEVIPKLINLPANGAGNATPAIYNDRVYFIGVTDNVLYSRTVAESLEESRQCLAYQDPVLVGLPGSSPAVSEIGIAYSTQGEPGVQIVGTPDVSDRWNPCGDSSAAVSTDLLAAQRPPSQMATANAEVAGSPREVYVGRKFFVSSALVEEPQSLLVSSPSMAGGVIVYVVQAVGTDVALYDVRIWDRDANSTAMLASSDRAFEASPAISNGFVFIGCNDGNLYALRLDGEQFSAG